MSTLDQYYRLCGLLGNDVYKAAFVVHSMYPVQCFFSYVLEELESLRLEKFAEVLDQISAMPDADVIETAAGATFFNQGQYVTYLTGLLDLHKIPYCHYKPKKGKS